MDGNRDLDFGIRIQVLGFGSELEIEGLGWGTGIGDEEYGIGG